MNITNNIVALSAAERGIFELCGMSNLDGRTSAQVLDAIDAKLDSWDSGSAIDVVNMRIIEKVRANMAAMLKVAQRQKVELKPYSGLG